LPAEKPTGREKCTMNIKQGILNDEVIIRIAFTSTFIIPYSLLSIRASAK